MNLYKKLTRKCWRLCKESEDGKQGSNKINISLWFIIKELLKYDWEQNYSINICSHRMYIKNKG